MVQQDHTTRIADRSSLETLVSAMLMPPGSPGFRSGNLIALPEDGRNGAAALSMPIDPQAVVLMLVGLDDLEYKLEPYGMAAKRSVLNEMRVRINDAAHAQLAAAPIGGTEFMILSNENEGRLAALAGRIVRTIREPFVMYDEVMSVHASVGSARRSKHETVASLVERADEALTVVRRQGGNNFLASEQWYLSPEAQRGTSMSKAFHMLHATDRRN